MRRFFSKTKRNLLPLAAVCLTVAANAQDFPGYRAGNYTGVNGVFFNPANIADSRYRVDFNLFSIHLGVGNDQASFKLKDQFKNFDTDSLKNQVFGNNAGAASGLINATIHGPSLMFALGPKAGIALTTRARVMANIRDMDGKLVDKIVSDFENDPDLPYTFSSNEDMQFAVNGWTEFGFSFAHVLMDQKTHFLKGGFTAKYLAGAANGYVNLGNLNGTIIEDANNPYLTNSTGRLGMGFGGVNIGDFEAGDLLKMESTGYGGDIGFVYEFRPNHEKFVYGEGQVRRDVNKYKLRLGVALTDIGSINYKRDVNRSGSYDINITGAERLDLTDLGDEDIDNFKDYFDSHPQYFTPAAGNADAEYKVSLPTALNIDLDLNLHRGFYIHAGAQISMAKEDNKPYNPSYYNGFTLTPRFEGRAFGLYVPINYNELTELNAGVSVRLGPLFVGSGSILTALTGESKQADFHVGLRFGGLQKNKYKKHKKNESQNSNNNKVAPENNNKKENKKEGGAAQGIEL